MSKGLNSRQVKNGESQLVTYIQVDEYLLFKNFIQENILWITGIDKMLIQCFGFFD